MRLEMGYCSELLTAPLILAANMTNSWLKHVWISTQDCQVTLMTNLANYPLQRQGDIELMRLFVQTGWKPPELTTLNHCRMFLQVFLLSDIVIGLGNSIPAQFWDQFTPLESTFDWPQTNKPSPNAGILWHKALTAALHLRCNQWLALPLGRWDTTIRPTLSGNLPVRPGTTIQVYHSVHSN